MKKDYAHSILRVADDTISRQTAIEELTRMYNAAEKWGREASDDVIKARAESCMASIFEMVMRIVKLPSAQPQQTCEYWDSESNFCTLHRPSAQPEITVDHALTEEEIKNIKQMMANSPLVFIPSAQPETQWIPCSERLPEDGTYVLGYMAYGQCSVLKCEGGRLYAAGCWAPLQKNAVMHWQYLPDAPNEKSDE